MAKIFISYAREDYKAAKRLYDFLISQGHEPWLDKENLLPGQKWESAVQSAIRECHFFIALLSPNSIEKRGYVQKELRAGLDILDQIPDSQVFLIPTRIGVCEPIPARLRELHWVDLFPNWDEGLERLNKVFTFVPKNIIVPTLVGTRWSLTQSVPINYGQLYFHDKGIVESSISDIGNWKQSGNDIYMVFAYSQFRGVIEENRINGEAQNFVGKEWYWEAVRIETLVAT